MAERKNSRGSGSAGKAANTKNTAKKNSRGASKNTSQSKGKSASRAQKKDSGKNSIKEEKTGGVHREVKIIVMAGVAILLFAFLISGSSEDAGIVGRAADSLLKGLFGVGAWIMPVALLGGAIYLIKEKNDTIFKIRVILSTVLFVVTIAFIQGFSGAEAYKELSLTTFVAKAYTNGSNTNGGLIGGAVFMGLYKLIGGAGTYIVLTLLILILLMLISGGSLIGLLRSTANSVRSKYDEYCSEEYEEDYYDDFSEYEDFEQEFEEDEHHVDKYPSMSDKNEEVKQPAVLEIRKGNKEKHKISIITEDFKSGERNSEGSRERDADNNITGILDLFTKPEIPNFFAPKEEEEKKISDADVSVTDADSLITEETKEKEIKQSAKIAGKSKHETEEDLPPFDEPYTEENEPEIIKAEKAKLVDSLDTEKKAEYKFPKLEFLGVNKSKSREKSREEILRKAKKLEETLAIFKVEAKVNNISIGPTVTRYELTPSVGTKVSAVTNLENDIKFSMAAESIIIEAPIPGKSAIGIEIPNDTRESVYFSEVLRSEQFQKFKSKIAFGLGEDITGSVKVADLAKMPHLLVAGTTGSGKSVCINTIIMSILYKASPDEVKMIMVDPKMVELSVYNGIPHLLLPVVTEPEKAAGALNWAVVEMERRYKMLAKTGTRNIEGYNQKVPEEEKLSQIVIIIDELADLMMVVGKEIETSICRLAQKARAAGMHLVLATQRPSADVLTGLIRSNVPSRIAFKVSGSMDSRIILDSTGAEKLLGKGDMLFKTADMPKPVRIQGAFITDDEVERVVSYISPTEPCYDESIIKEIESASTVVAGGGSDGGGDSDALTDEVLEWIVANPKCASAGKVQRHFRIGFNRASRIIEELEDRGILGPTNGSQPREVLMDKYELRERKERYEDL